VRAGLPAVKPPPIKPDSFASVAANYLKRHVAASGLRTQYEIERVIRRYVLPEWGERAFVDIKRSDVASLLDRVEDAHGRHTADVVLARVRAVAHWYALRHDSYASPFTRGMRRTDPKARKRARILNDDEICALWRATKADGRYNGIIRLLLLTGQRRECVGSMKWADLALDGTWTIPNIDRGKGTGGAICLPPIALEILRRQPRLSSNPFVFGVRGGKPFCGWSLPKRELDAALPAWPAWTVHDLRRTSRSLMSRAGVPPHVAERVLGHTQGGVQGIYDRHTYGQEKADALARLAGLIERIVNPPVSNVLPLTKA
jgi:integrase